MSGIRRDLMKFEKGYRMVLKGDVLIEHFRRLAERADRGETVSLKGMTDAEILALIRGNG